MGENENGDITQGQNENQDLTGNVDGTSNSDGQPSGDSGGGHPAWQEILSILPDEFHPLVTPKLQAWDSGVQTRFQNLQSQYEPYKPFVENEVDPEYLQQAIGLAAAIEQDPERVYKALAEAYGYDQGVTDSSGANNADEDDEDADPYEQRLAEHERMMEQMAEAFLADQNSREMQEGEQMLDQYMSALHEAYDGTGGFDDQYVLTLISQGIDGEQAVKQFQQTVQQFAGPNNGNIQPPAGPQAPVVMGGGGGSPSNRVDHTRLSDADTRDLVANLLKAANES